jgi:HD-like signal output (HDOD) protein
MVAPLDVTKFEHLKASGDLPSPKGVALAIIRLIQQEDSSMGDLARVIKTDPAFVGRLIKAANGLVGYNRRAIVSVQEALMVLGLPAVRTLALGFPCCRAIRMGAARVSTTVVTGQVASSMHWRCRPLRSEPSGCRGETFCLGLLVRIGELALATLYPGTTASVAANCGIPGRATWLRWSRGLLR